jgi:ligand-binding sensor domain-containing protein
VAWAAYPVRAQPAPASYACPCYALTAWTPDVGLPGGNILAVTQGHDDSLWLGTNRGLVRFDGLEFSQWPFEGGAGGSTRFVAVVHGARDGSLWAGFGDSGGVTRIDGRQSTHFSMSDGIPGGQVSAILEDEEGRIWIGGRGGLSVFHERAWRRLGGGEGLADVEVSSLFETSDGRVLVGTSAGVYTKGPDSDHFELAAAEFVNVESFAEDTSGDVWLTDSRRIVARLDSAHTVKYGADVELPSPGWRLQTDEFGQLWIAGLGGGLFRVDTTRPRDQQVVERFAYEHRFLDGSAGGARSLLVDARNNLWVGMRGGGLLRVARTAIDTDVRLEGLTNDGVRGLAATPDGSVWVATGRSLNRFDGPQRYVYDVDSTTALHADRDGHLWLATLTRTALTCSTFSDNVAEANGMSVMAATMSRFWSSRSVPRQSGARLSSTC